MLDKVRLACAHCGRVSFHSESYIKGQIKAMKMHRAYESAAQLHVKSGPFYDKWLAAGGGKGTSERCIDCLGFLGTRKTSIMAPCGYKDKLVQGNWFACRLFRRYYRD